MEHIHPPAGWDTSLAVPSGKLREN